MKMQGYMIPLIEDGCFYAWVNDDGEVKWSIGDRGEGTLEEAMAPFTVQRNEHGHIIVTACGWNDERYMFKLIVSEPPETAVRMAHAAGLIEA